MAEMSEAMRYCLACGAQNAPNDQFCTDCGRLLESSERQEREGTLFLLNELERLRADGAIPTPVYMTLRRRYREQLGIEPPPVAPTAPAPEPAAPAPPRAAPPKKREGPGWLAEQQANLLLYVGAFLIVIAAVIFVSASGGAINDVLREALFALFTAAFLAAGLVCRRFPKVVQAGMVFFAVGALMVPLNFVAVYVFFLSDEDLDPTGLWLAGSMSSAIFYGAVSFLGIGRWYTVPAVAAVLVALGSFLELVGAQDGAYPLSYIALAFVLALPKVIRLGKVSDLFETSGWWAANIIVPLALLLALTSPASGYHHSAEFWYFPATAALAAAYYGVLALQVDRSYSIASIGAAFAALASTVVISGTPVEAYPASFTVAAGLLCVPAFVPLRKVTEAFGETGFWAANVIVAATAIFAPFAPQAGEEIARLPEVTAGWFLAPSIALIAAFYAAVALLQNDRWFGAPAVAAALGTLGAVLYVVGAPAEAYPGSFVALALVLALAAMLNLGRASDVFGEAAFYATNAVVPLALLTALALAGVPEESTEFDLELATRWFLPPAIALGAAFYWSQAVWSRWDLERLQPLFTVVALSVSAAAAVTLVYALDVGRQWYGPAVAIVGAIYAAGSEGFGPRWFGQRYPGWMALGAMTVAWLAFEGIYEQASAQGAGVHVAATALYLVAARLVTTNVELFEMATRSGEKSPDWFRVPLSVVLIYGAGITLGAGFYHLLASLPAAEGAETGDAAWPYFALSVAVAAAAATLRLWWSEARPHAYVVALGLSLFVLLTALQLEGQVAVQLAAYTGVALALTLWEREPFALPVPAAYGFFAILAAWRYFEPVDAYFPLAFALVAGALFAGYLLGRTRLPRWALVLQLLAFAFAVAGPIAGWVRLDHLADPQGFVGEQSFEETALYQTSTAAVAVLGLLAAVEAALSKRLWLALGASAVFMVALLLEIGHFRPDNIQAYTVPIAVYLLASALLALRMRDLPVDLRTALGPLEAFAAGLLMMPSFVQSFEDGAWAYAVILLAESLSLLGLGIVQRRLWLVGIAISFTVLNGVHYLFFVGGSALPNWAILALAGTAVMAAGTLILLGRDQWTRWQMTVLAWWNREPLPS